jgi:hypothetical protein
MTPLVRGLVIAAAQVALVASVGAKLVYDRATLPRVWAPTVGFDPTLPIRGRYVQLQLALQVDGDVGLTRKRHDSGQRFGRVKLHAAGDQLAGTFTPGDAFDMPGTYSVSERATPQGNQWVLDAPVAYYLPEHAADPTRVRRTGE